MTQTTCFISTTTVALHYIYICSHVISLAWKILFKVQLVPTDNVLHRTLKRLTLTHILNYNDKMTIQHSSVTKLFMSYIHICMTDHRRYSFHRSYIIRQYLQNWTQLELTGGALKHRETTHYCYKQQPCTRMLLTFCSVPKLGKKVLRPATSTQVFLGFPVPKIKFWSGSQDSKLPLRASHIALPS